MTEVQFVDHSTVELLDCNATDLKVARAAWVSQDAEAHRKEAEEGRIEGLINFLYRNRHMSPFEHGQFNFRIETPIFVAREFMRHRTMSYNEVSGRYKELEPRFYLPNVEERPLRQSGKVGAYIFELGDDTQQAEVEFSVEFASREAWASYQNMLNEGVAKEVARMVLPVNTMTTFWASVNPRNLMQFLDLRTDVTALYEIREVANKMALILREQMPITYQAWHFGGLPPNWSAK